MADPGGDLVAEALRVSKKPLTLLGAPGLYLSWIRPEFNMLLWYICSCYPHALYLHSDSEFHELQNLTTNHILNLDVKLHYSVAGM